MRLKKLLFMMVLLTIAGRAMADGLSIDPVSVKAGGEAVKVPINLSLSSETYSAMQFDLVLPKGTSVALNNSNNLRILLAESHRQVDEDEQKSHQLSSSQTASDENSTTYTIVIFDAANAKLKDGEGAIANFYIKADESANGDLTGSIKNIMLAASGGSSGVGSGSANLTDVSFTITVQGKPTVTADNKSREYGEANPELTYTVNPTEAEVGTITLTTDAVATSNVGDYTITVPTSDNYNAVNGTMTVTKAPLTISGGTYTIKQGEALPTLTPEFSGFKNNETAETALATQPTLTLPEGVSSASEPGEYAITVAGATATNYDITFENGKLTITDADLVTVTANSYEITYGDALPTFEYTSEGATLNGTPTITCEAPENADAGTYTITIGKGSVTNYNDHYFNGTLTIKPAPLTIKVTDAEKTYGDENPTTFAVTYSGFVKEQNESVLTGALAFDTEATAASGVGSYDVSASGLTSTNYTITYEKGSLKVNKATLTAKAKDASVMQGEANPEFEIEYTGWKNGDDVSKLTTVPTATTTRKESDAPAEYDITVGGGEADNYEFTYVNGKLTVTKATLVTFTAKSYTINYGDPIPAFEFTADQGIVASGAPSITCEATTTSPVGTYPIVISQGDMSYYNMAFVNGTLTIEKAPLTAKAKSISVEQGVATPTLEIEYEGFKNNETEAVLDTKPTASTTRTVDSEPGNYDITVDGGEDNNYQITTQNGTLTVTAPAKVTVTVTSCERKYGEENPTFAYTVSGGTLSGEPEIACTATKTSAPGEYDITIEKGTIANYSYELVPGKLTVKPAQLTVTAENKTKAYGEALPELTYTITGFVNDETDDVVTTKPTITTTATAASDAGEYPITVEGAAAANYDITYVAGKLTVTGKSLTLNVSLSPSSYTYDGSAKTPTVTVTAADNTTITEADYVLGGDLSATNAGSYTITATPKGNYSGSAASANWTIEPSTTTDAQGNTITEDGTNVTLESASSNDIADDGGLTVPNGITQISSTAFSSIVDKSSVEYVDLSNTSVSGVTVDRQSGVFNGFSDNTIIYMPSGNSAAEDEPNVVIGGTCQELVLTEGEGMEIPTAFNASKVTYNRALTAQQAGTICLPYSLTSDATVGYYQLSSSTAEALVFTEVATTTANEPYLVVPKTAGASLSKTLSTAISSNKNLNAEKGITGFKMVGTMKAIDHAAAIGKYILQSDNKWHKVTDASPAAAAIGAYHAYIEGTGAARLAIILDGSDGTTALRSIQTVDADGAERWYDLNGRRLQSKPTQKGAYIVNGKKIVK